MAEPSYEDLLKREEHKEHGTTAGIVLLGDGDHEEVDQGIRSDTTCPVGDLLDLNGTQFRDGEAAGGFKYDTSVDQSSGVTPLMLTEVQSGLFRLPDITSTCANSSPIGGKDTITHLISSEMGPAITSALSNGEGQEVASDFNLPGARSPTAITKDDITREDSYGDTGCGAADSVEENSEDETSIATVYQRIPATSEMLPSRGQASMQDVLSGAGTNLIGILGSVTGTGDAESERRKCDDSLVSVDGGELPGFEEKSHSSDTIYTVPKDTQSSSTADASQGLEGVEGSGCDAFCILSTENVSMFNSSEMPGKSSALDTTPVLSATTQESCRTVPEPSAAGVNSLGDLLLPEQQSMTVVGLGHEDLGAFEDIKLVDMPIGQEGSLIISDIGVLPAVQDVPGITPGDSILESDVFTDLVAMASQSDLQAVPRDVGCKDENGARHSRGDKEVHKAEKSRDSVEPVSEEGKATMCTPISSPQTLCAIAGSVLERSQPGLSSVREVPRQEVLPGIGHEEEGDLGMLVQSAESSVSSTLPLCEISGIEDWPGPSGIVRSSTVANAPTAAADATIPEGRGPAEVVPAEPETSMKFEASFACDVVVTSDTSVDVGSPVGEEAMTDSMDDISRTVVQEVKGLSHSLFQVLDKLQKTPPASRKQITVPKEALDLHKMLHSAESLGSCPAVEVTSVVCSADDVLTPGVEKSQEEELQETASREKSKKKKKKHGKKR